VAGVEAAHRRRIVRRDLEPENVLLAQGEAGEVPKVIDFGLARPVTAGEASELHVLRRS
jgi:eukaryotic-like serine/threonine-protein kinase